MIPFNINIGSQSINTVIATFVIGFFCWFFILWNESRKDGFNSDRFFNLVFSTVIFSGVLSYLFYRLIEWTKIYRPGSELLYFDRDLLLSVSFFLLVIPIVYYFSRKYKWSSFRILDIYALAFSILLIIVGLGNYLILEGEEYIILALSSIFLYFFIMRHRGYKYTSGVIFSAFLFYIALFLLVYLRKGGYLLFAPILVTIGVLNLYLRGKKTMSKSVLPKNLISKIKKKLLSKDKRLEEEQQALISNDPYLQPGRETDNAETLDDVLEDTGKTITDARLNIVDSLRIQVRKALAAINLGTYGKCEVCGKPIDKARLEVYPEATTCIECATDRSQMSEVKEDEILERNS
jgi:DnaK suppressor protein